jgi:hypothetical protein
MAANAELRAREAADKRTTDAEKHAAESTTKRDYTRVELQKFVDDGKISQVDANALWDKQTETKILANVDAKLDARLKQDSHAVAVQAQVDRYKELIPDMLLPDSEARRKVDAEFRSLVDLGQPDNKADGGLTTELLALRAVFGPAEALQRSRAELQTHQESGARGGDFSSDGDSLTKEGWPKGLSERQRTHYEDQIRKGIYKSKKDVIAMHERVAKRRTARAG